MHDMIALKFTIVVTLEEETRQMEDLVTFYYSTWVTVTGMCCLCDNSLNHTFFCVQFSVSVFYFIMKGSKSMIPFLPKDAFKLKSPIW